MPLQLSTTFTDSLARLTPEEQKLVKTTAFDLHLNPANPGNSFHRLENTRDKRFWSIRVSANLRLILHKTDANLLLCYVDHHDKAYAWAERRKLEVHPTTGAAQWVEIRETVREVPARAPAPAPAPASPVPPAPPKPAPLLFKHLSDIELLAYGIPADWLADVRSATEHTLLDLTAHLPAEAAEALLEIATGGRPKPQAPAPQGSDPFAHPDAQRRFRAMADAAELEQALNYPWDKWIVFLHPAQRQWIERDYNGPARVSGSAGTGKTIVALHRAVHLARTHADARVLLTTFGPALAAALRDKVRRLTAGQPQLLERVDVEDLDGVARRLHQRLFGAPRVISDAELAEWLSAEAKAQNLTKASPRFLLGEWTDLVEPQNLTSWEAYRDARRLGRKTRVTEAQRAAMWAVFANLQARLLREGMTTRSGMLHRLAAAFGAGERLPYDHVVVDEAQDLTVPQLRLLAAMVGNRANGLFFAGDLGQRIFQTPFSWQAQGVDIRGRSRNLKVNYRTSHQIRARADKLLAPELSDVDGNIERRTGTVSAFDGAEPEIARFASAQAEIAATAAWLTGLVQSGVAASEIGVFVRSDNELERALAAVAEAGQTARVLDDRVTSAAGRINVGTMHLAKGLEFKAVAVMACDDEVLPCQARIGAVADDNDLEDVYNTERHLLYVACTRARDRLRVSGVEPVSEFLDDLA